jgi:RHS repeat-associated protein
MVIKLKARLIVLLFLTSSISGFSQNPLNITKSNQDSGNKIYVAQEDVVFLPGYDYDGSQAKLHAYIDKETDYAQGFTNSTFNNATIDQNLPIGGINGSHSVTSTGAGLYTINLDLPLGTNGMSPNLSIIYNSQGGNSNMGVGWGLNGISQISLANTNWYYDEELENVELDGKDKFTVDGSRLFSTNGTYGANGTTYSTEIESYSRVTSYGGSGVPDWFKIETKDGITMEYGRTEDSRIREPGNKIINWKIKKIYDTHSNYIEFEYWNYNGEQHIKRIRYTGNEDTGLAPYNVVKFNYETRNDKNSIYFAGKEIKQNHLLKEIEIFTNGENFKSYGFTYSLNHNSYLSSVEETGSNGEKLNATIFKYGEKNQDIETLLCPTFNGLSADFQASRDFNGDGKSDVLVSHFYYSNGNKVYTTWEVFVANTDNSFSHYASGIIPSGYYMFFHHNKDDIKTPGLRASLDFYGDGSDDILLVKINAASSGVTLSDIKIINITGLDQTQTYSLNFTSGGYIRMDKFLHIGDYDGDGRDDILLFKYGSNINLEYSAKLITSHSGEKNVSPSRLRFLHSSIEHYSTDFDGDGKREIMVIYANSCEIFELESKLTNNSYAVNRIYNSASPGFPTQWHNILTGDFNGDGKTDILTTGNGLNGSIGYSNGVSFIEEPFQFSHNFISSSSSQSLKIGDYNGDGKSDILHSYNVWTGNVATESKIDIYYSNGKGFNYKSFEVDLITSHDDFTVADFNGDGKADIFNRDYYASPTKMYYFNKNGEDFLLNKVKDGFGNVTEFNCEWLTNNNVYSNIGLNSVPNNENSKPLHVVKNVLTPDGIGGIMNVSYNYKGARWNRQGKGFLGFHEITSTNNNTGYITKVENIIYEDPSIPYVFLFLKKRETTSLISNGNLISQTTFTNSVSSLGGKRVKANVSEVVAEDYINSFSKTTEFTYDNNGNLETSVEENGVESKVVQNQYLTFGNWWIPAKLASSTSYQHRYGQTPFINTINYEYTPKGSLKQVTTHPTTSNELINKYFYDNYGNIIRTTISASGHVNRVKETQYDNQGRLPIKLINELNQESTIQYHPIFAKPISVVDVDGLVSTITYDNFGNTEQSIDKYGIQSNILKQWVNTNPTNTTGNPLLADDIMYKITESKQGKPDKTIHYNRLGQQRMKEIQGLNNPIFSVTTYNEKGQVAAQTEPFFQGATTIGLNETVYDEFGRPLSQTSNGETVSYTYEVENQLQKTTTNNPDGSSNNKYIDASGQLIKSEDNGGLIEYAYFSHGGVIDTKLNNQVVATSEYDALGRQTKLIDINAGEIQYEYNAFNDIIEQVNANGQVKTYSYDNFGRLLQIDNNGIVTEYQYIQNGNGINQLKKVSIPNHDQIFEYDLLGRVSKTTEVIDGVSFDFEYNYNSLNEVEQMVYPSGLIVNNIYDNNGYLLEVQDENNNILWKGLIQDEFGRYVEYSKGDGVITNLYYDAFQNIEEIVAGNVQHNIYNWEDETGNLTNRKNLINGMEEFFEYDNLNRLTKSTASAIGSTFTLLPLEVNYTPNGNITDKTYAGNYSYHPTKPNAVTDVTNGGQNISLLTQDITYDANNKASQITEGDYTLQFQYGIDNQRRKTTLYDQNGLVIEKYFVGLYEKEIEGNTSRHINYISASDGMTAIVLEEEQNGSSTTETYFTYKDHLGSIIALTDDNGNIALEQSFDAWGSYRNTNNWTYSNLTSAPTWFRGYTGHEHLPHFNLINMNGRIYDPILGRMLSPDNYVQEPLFSQSYNRYSYVWNNPLRYTDPSGEIVWAPIIIGAAVGTYIGGTMANGTYNPGQWDYTSGRTWGYMAGGALVGAASGYVGGVVASSGMPLANTASIVSSSYISSVGTHIYTGGQSDVSIGVGFASYNVSQNDWSGLGGKGNSFIENIGYVMGALTNISDGVNALDNAKAIKQAAQSPEEQAEIVSKKFKTEGKFIKDKYIGANGRGNPEIAWANGHEAKTAVGIGAYNHDVYYYQKGADGALSAFFNTNVISSDRTLLQVARAAKGSSYSLQVRFGTSIFLGFKTAIVNNYIFYPSLIIQR